MIIRCTQKLLKELKRDLVEEPTSPTESWHANLLLIERRKCVLLTHDETLYSIFMPGLRQPEFKQFPDLVGQRIFKRLLGDGFPQPQIEYMLDQMRVVEFAKTNNRSVLGSMRDIASRIKHSVIVEGGLNQVYFFDMHQQINRAPMSAIDYNNGLDAMRSKLQRQTR